MTTKKNEKTGKWRQSITLKLMVVVALSLILLIPSAMIRSLIDERENRKNETISEITGKWGNEQTICGPVFIVPYTVLTKYSDGTTSETEKYFQILPDKLILSGNIDTEIRYRSIYEVLTYSGNFTLKGSLNTTELDEWPSTYSTILWNETKMVVGISDLKGISKSITVKWNEDQKKFSPGIANCKMFNSGINVPVEVEAQAENQFEISLNLNGSNAIFVTPIANETEVKFTADWGTPSFDGTFLPTDKKISESGFEANWNTNEMNRTYPQIMMTDNLTEYFDYQSVGVRLLLPVDAYQKSTRSVKYALLFIALSFLILFFSEIISKGRIHPVQYLIVGIALVIFYSLLIALAEYIGFNLAFLAASLVIVSMITAYVHSLFKKVNITVVIASALVLLYVYLFTVVQVADYALIIGNIGLVIILGLIMIFSKKIDWYGNQQNAEQQEATNEKTI
jgi:inner membrane protein